MAPRNGRPFDPLRQLEFAWAANLAGLQLLARQKQREFEAAMPRLREEARAAGSGFVDGISAGTADYLSAGLKVAGGQGGKVVDRYKKQLAAEREQDQRDKAEYGGARMAGQGAGTVAGIGLTGAAFGSLNALRAAAALQAVGRLAPNFVHVARVGAAAGGVAGVAGQAAVDAATRTKPEPAKYVAAGLGGILGGVTAPYLGVGRAGVLAGSAAPWLQPVVDGDAPAPLDVAAGAALGSLGGKRVSESAAKLFNGLDNAAKQAFGERSSVVSSFLRRESPLWYQRREYLPGGGYTVADHITNKSVVEAKAGAQASLSFRQRQAQRELANYLVEHWLPRDFGDMAAMSLVGLGAPTIHVPVSIMLSATRRGEAASAQR